MGPESRRVSTEGETGDASPVRPSLLGVCVPRKLVLAPQSRSTSADESEITQGLCIGVTNA